MEMSKPPNLESTTIRQVSGTNSYLTKSFDGSMGLYLIDVTDQLPSRRYKHLNITMHRKKEVVKSGKKTLILRNVLFLQSDHEVSPTALTLILELLHEREPSGQFTASNMIEVLDEVEELLRRPRSLPQKEDVVGAWGELYILRLLLQNTSIPELQRKIIAGWEGETREKLDFRFLHAEQALEIKTTMSSERIHHLHGLEQITIPAGFEHGAVASLCVDADQGYTCEHLLTSIEKLSVGNEKEKFEYSKLLSKRVLVRGQQLCEDNRYHFELSVDGLKFFDFSNVPSPGSVENVIPIEWLSDLSNSQSLTTTESENLISRITS